MEDGDQGMEFSMPTNVEMHVAWGAGKTSIRTHTNQFITVKCEYCGDDVGCLLQTDSFSSVNSIGNWSLCWYDTMIYH